MNRDEILLQEYADAAENTRHYSNLQFAQLTIYCAIAAGAASQMYGEHALSGCPRVLVCIGTSLLGVCFMLMSCRVNEYWNARVERAKAIEKELQLQQYSVPPPKAFISNRAAVYFCYWILIVAFVVMICAK